MLMACRIFSGWFKGEGNSRDDYVDRYYPGSTPLILYVIDELSLKAETRHDTGFQHLIDLLAIHKDTGQTSNQDHVEKDRLVDSAFSSQSGYSVMEYLSKYIKPVTIIEQAGTKMSSLSVSAWKNYYTHYRVWVNVQDGAKSIATPTVGYVAPDLRSIRIANA